jgi:hypothetical protein
MRTEGQTGRHDEADSCFSRSCEKRLEGVFNHTQHYTQTEKGNSTQKESVVI